MATNNQGWRIDKHIPVAVIIAIAVQTAGVIWWASDLSTRIDILERFRIEQLQSSKEDAERIRNLEGQVPAILNELENINKGIDRIDKKLDKISAIHFPLTYEPDYLTLSLTELSEVNIS